ncbi:MAG: hypothetical protein V2B18_21075, partial [Pseudomonadota bacterium]
MGKRIIIQDFVTDVRDGVKEAVLMDKYELSRKQLMRTYEKLLDTGQLLPRDLEDPLVGFEATIELADTCRECGSLLLADTKECPLCGTFRDLNEAPSAGKKTTAGSTAAGPGSWRNRKPTRKRADTVRPTPADAYIEPPTEGDYGEIQLTEEFQDLGKEIRHTAPPPSHGQVAEESESGTGPSEAGSLSDSGTFLFEAPDFPNEPESGEVPSQPPGEAAEPGIRGKAEPDLDLEFDIVQDVSERGNSEIGPMSAEGKVSGKAPAYGPEPNKDLVPATGESDEFEFFTAPPPEAGNKPEENGGAVAEAESKPRPKPMDPGEKKTARARSWALPAAAGVAALVLGLVGAGLYSGLIPSFLDSGAANSVPPPKPTVEKNRPRPGESKVPTPGEEKKRAPDAAATAQPIDKPRQATSAVSVTPTQPPTGPTDPVVAVSDKSSKAPESGAAMGASDPGLKSTPPPQPGSPKSVDKPAPPHEPSKVRTVERATVSTAPANGDRSPSPEAPRGTDKTGAAVTHNPPVPSNPSAKGRPEPVVMGKDGEPEQK